MTSSAEHWDRIFSGAADDQLGWFEQDAGAVLGPLYDAADWQKRKVFIAGNGTSALAGVLLQKGDKLTINDISQSAIDRLKVRLGKAANQVDYICQDIAQPLPAGTPKADVWIDRAVLHFLLREDAINGYFQNLDRVLLPGGLALFAEFSQQGASRCAGLDVHRYDVAELALRLGPEFTLLYSLDHIHKTPAGKQRAYIHALFQRDS
ncbi:MAG: class I SAM-dependent methyltransferase [Xanthomonadales bacterium]|nr:class I SAM-dependent methyltransferase [Xanthomonadales bacterium]